MTVDPRVPTVFTKTNNSIKLSNCVQVRLLHEIDRTLAYINPFEVASIPLAMFLFFLLLFGSYAGSRLIGRGSGIGSRTSSDMGVDTNPIADTNAAAGGNFDGGWLSRLGWGLGEASLEALVRISRL